MLVGQGYHSLQACPEIQTAVNRVADLISSMTIHLMQNTKDGDKRIKNELSRKIDINPNKLTSRKNWMYAIVRNMMLDGDGNCIQLPHYDTGGYLDDIEPFDMTQTSINPLLYGYQVNYKGRIYQPDEILHFVDNPDPQKPWIGQGYRVLLKDVAKSLAQATKTKNSLMSSPTPSIIVKVDGLTEEFASSAGRAKLMDQYVDANSAGKPWFIPAELFSVEQVKPLTLNDLAIKDSISIDKATAAAIFGVPPFLVGQGVFDREAYNNFISSIVLPKARGIEQELTRKLLLSPDWYFRFNPRSLYSYSLTEIAEVAANYVDRAIIDRNEARDWSGWTPREGLSELAILENYIPYSKIGQQGKLKQTGGDENGNSK
nr:MAG TPA: portal protein [Caudoviricetes sp.]